MKNALFITLSVCLVSGCATVKEVSPFHGAHSEFDQDGDGVISKREARNSPGLSNNFDRIDTNRSGGISSDEYTAATMQLGDLSFDEVDINSDGVISEREAGAMPVSLKEAFGTVDTDGDGNVSETEYKAGRTNLLQDIDFEDIDTDGDGIIGEQEAKKTPVLSEAYDRIDTDADGMIGRDEYKAAQR